MARATVPHRPEPSEPTRSPVRAELGDLDRRVRSNTSRICEVIVIDGELS